MFKRQNIDFGLDVVVDFDYTYTKENSNTATITASIGLIVVGAEHSGKTVNLSSNGAFVFNQNFVIPTIRDSKKHVYMMAMKSVDQVIVRNQSYTMDLVVTCGEESERIGLSTLVYTVVGNVSAPSNLSVSPVANTNNELFTVGWKNNAMYYGVEIYKMTRADNNGYVTVDVSTIAGNPTGTTLMVGDDNQYQKIMVRGLTDVPAIRSGFASAEFRRPMKTPTSVLVRTMRNGLLLTWTDPNVENAGLVLKYRIEINTPSGTSYIIMESDQRAYYFANLPIGELYSFTVSIIDPVTGVTYSQSVPSNTIFLPFIKVGENQPYDYRLGTMLVNALYVGSKPVWTRN